MQPIGLLMSQIRTRYALIVYVWYSPSQQWWYGRRDTEDGGYPRAIRKETRVEAELVSLSVAVMKSTVFLTVLSPARG